MSDEVTKDQNGKRPFEERVLSMLTEMSTDFNKRLEKLEAKQYDTKPIWEQALAEIVGVRKEIEQTNKRLEDFDVRFDRVESDVAKTRSEMLTMRADFRELRGQLRELLPALK